MVLSHGMSFERASEDVIELLISSGGKKLVNTQSKSDRERSSLQICLEHEEGHCPKKIISSRSLQKVETYCTFIALIATLLILLDLF